MDFELGGEAKLIFLDRSCVCNVEVVLQVGLAILENLSKKFVSRVRLVVLEYKSEVLISN